MFSLFRGGSGQGVNGQSFHGPMILRLSAARRQEREWRQPLPTLGFSKARVVLPRNALFSIPPRDNDPSYIVLFPGGTTDS
jgi:hypothetical protein